MMTVTLFLIILTLGQRVSSYYWDNWYDRTFYRRCPSGQAVYRVESHHNNHYEDRVWTLGCRRAAVFNHCFWSGFMNWFDQPIHYNCRSDYVVAGMYSYHSNYHEDRRWQFLCCLSPRLATSDCRWTGYVNNWDQYLYWRAPAGNYLKGVISYHSNRKEDRRWKFQYCKGGAPTASTGPSSWCGVPDIKPRISGYTSRIVNGQIAKSGSWPWQVSLQKKRRKNEYIHNCGGSLINRYWVVTAAHCKVIPGSDRVILGEHDRGSNREQTQTRSVSKTITHPNYNPNLNWPDHDWMNYDVALVKLSYPAQLNFRVSPVCLSPSSLSFPSGTRCVTTGWGKTKHSAKTFPDILQQVALSLLSNAQCKQKKYWGNSITDTMICTGASRASNCNGDSGGPLVCERGGVWTLVGIFSWMHIKCKVNKPSVFIRVSKVRSWIDKTVASN